MFQIKFNLTVLLTEFFHLKNKSLIDCEVDWDNGDLLELSGH